MSVASEKSEKLKNHFDFEDLNEEWGDKSLMMARPEADGSSCGSNSEIATRSSEEEMLTSSLMSLTTHFAQVQLRLSQIVEAPPDQRDDLLQGLVEFAFSGIPEVPPSSFGSGTGTPTEFAAENNRQLIDSLKTQLEELEKYAYESGAGVLPQSILLEKQKVIIDEIKRKINLNVDETDLPQLSPDDIKKQVDSALGEFVSPLKMKEQLVTQLKTQIADLERFIKFLQIDAGSSKKRKRDLKCECNHEHVAQEASSSVTSPRTSTVNDKALSVVDKVATMLQFFAVSQFGCGVGHSHDFQMNSLKKTHKHWGDLRAQLEVDVQEVIMLARDLSKLTEEEELEQQVLEMSGGKKRLGSSSSFDSSSGKLKISSPELTALQTELTTTVRKRLAMTVEKLMEHGLRGQEETSGSIVPFLGCFSHVRRDYPDVGESSYREMHAWELILEYYHIKRGDQYNETPARMLSQSFNLDILPPNNRSNKQSLLGAIGNVVALHSPYRRSHNAHFKAFLSAAMNAKKLSQWLNLIFQCKDLIRTFYTDWSYVRATGFQDALKCLDQLSKYDFDLPIDLAIRQFENITDMFI